MFDKDKMAAAARVLLAGDLRREPSEAELSFVIEMANKLDGSKNLALAAIF